MKSFRRLAVFMIFALIISIGGVYATWNYAQGDITSRSVYLDSTTKITDKVIDTAKGTLTLDANGVNITVDDSNNDHKSELSITGDVTVRFTPSSGADEEIMNNGITVMFALSKSANWQYNSVDIFNVTTDAQAVVMVKNGDFFEGTISDDTLADLIEMPVVTLDTVAKYDAFKQALHDGSIGITVYDAANPPA